MTIERQTNEKIVEHDTQIKNLSDIMTQMNAKLDNIDEKINKINLEIHENSYDLDRRVTALESKLETLKWVFGSSVVILAALQFFITYLH